VCDRLREAQHVALFLDFDGTLVPLQSRPEDVWLEGRTRRVLRRLLRHPRATLWIISGRRRTDVRKRVGVSGLHYAGLHGFERRGKGPMPSRVRTMLVHARKQLAELLEPLPGAWIENKGLSLVAHYGGPSEAAARGVRRAVRQVCEEFAPDLRVLPGKKVWELLPAEVQGKGAAVRALLADLPPRTLPIYLGDDATDESAFRALPEGLTVRVGTRLPTRARFELRSPQEAREFLERLAAELARGGVGRTLKETKPEDCKVR